MGEILRLCSERDRGTREYELCKIKRRKISLMIPSRLAEGSGWELTIQEKSASLIVGCDALQERQRIADSI